MGCFPTLGEIERGHRICLSGMSDKLAAAGTQVWHVDVRQVVRKQVSQVGFNCVRTSGFNCT